jgi:hypothetical protein
MLKLHEERMKVAGKGLVSSILILLETQTSLPRQFTLRGIFRGGWKSFRCSEDTRCLLTLRLLEDCASLFRHGWFPIHSSGDAHLLMLKVLEEHLKVAGRGLASSILILILLETQMILPLQVRNSDATKESPEDEEAIEHPVSFCQRKATEERRGELDWISAEENKKAASSRRTVRLIFFLTQPECYNHWDSGFVRGDYRLRSLQIFPLFSSWSFQN